MAKEMGWDTGESGRSKPETKAQPETTNRGRDQTGKETGKEVQVARYHIGISGSEGAGI